MEMNYLFKSLGIKIKAVGLTIISPYRQNMI